jgi:lactate permease
LSSGLALVTALLVAPVVYQMPAGLAFDSALFGVEFGIWNVIWIAFAFGALLEGIASGGAPVAITGAMLFAAGEGRRWRTRRRWPSAASATR